MIRNTVIVPDNRATAIQSGAVRPNQTQNQNTPQFKDVLNNTLAEQTQGLQFTKHANMRLNARDIELSSEQLKRVEDGVSRAQKRGIRDSLVVVDDVALVVNIRKRVVITVTAMNQGNDNVYTNIDGAVIV